MDCDVLCGDAAKNCFIVRACYLDHGLYNNLQYEAIPRTAQNRLISFIMVARWRWNARQMLVEGLEKG